MYFSSSDVNSSSEIYGGEKRCFEEIDSLYQHSK